MYASVRRYEGNAELAGQLSSRADDVWLKENVPNLPAPPAVSAGEVLLQF